MFAPVVEQTTFKILLAVASAEKMKVEHLEVKTTFLYGELEELIVVEGKEEKVCLLRSIYGLKQAGRQSTNDLFLFTLAIGKKLCHVLIR